MHKTKLLSIRKGFLCSKNGFFFILSLLFCVLNIAFAYLLLRTDKELQNTAAYLSASHLLEEAASNSIPHVFQGGYPESEFIGGRSWAYQELADYVTTIAEQKGAPYAYGVLRVAPIPESIDIHLLGHAVGDVLYAQRGVDGITECAHDFRNACSHAIVTGLFSENGEAAFPEIAEICERAPGGQGAYALCYHGLGHGVLAYVGYDFSRAVSICKHAETAYYHRGAYQECVGGAVMEMLGTGSHNKALWEMQRKRYFNEENPTALCSGLWMDDIARPTCYQYLTPYLLIAVGSGLNGAVNEDYQKAFLLCNRIPETEVASRNACYAGFGKEFVAFVPGPSMKNASPSSLADHQFKKIYERCLLADNIAGVRSCIRGVLNTLYWGGEYPDVAAIQFCSLIVDDTYQEACFSHLIGAVLRYVSNSSERSSFCGRLPLPYQDQCYTMLL